MNNKRNGRNLPFLLLYDIYFNVSHFGLAKRLEIVKQVSESLYLKGALITASNTQSSI